METNPQIIAACTVTFNNCVTVYSADDYYGKRPWMCIAIDRVRFRRRIHQTELILARYCRFHTTWKVTVNVLCIMVM